MVSPLTNVFSTMKKQGLVKMLDQYLLKVEYEDDGDRKNETNSPSGALGCSRANIYQRLGTRKDTIAPRTRRIFDNGHGVHDRLQTYLEKAGVLMMREVPLSNKQDEIQGHTDGLLCRDVKAAAKGRIDSLHLKPPKRNILHRVMCICSVWRSTGNSFVKLIKLMRNSKRASLSGECIILPSISM